MPQIKPALSVRLTLLSVLSGALLSSCGSNGPTKVTMTAYDLTSGKPFQYETTTAFAPSSDTLVDFPQYVDELAALKAVNAIRQAGARCPDGTYHSGLPPIQFEGHLHKSATQYANWMQQHSYQLTNKPENHTADGNYPVQRMVKAGYLPAKTTYFAESLEQGATNSAQLILDWQASQFHCDTLFDPRLNWGSLARSNNPDPEGGYYWVLNVASF